MKTLFDFLKDDSGQDLAEYVGVLGAIAVVIAVVVVRYRDRLINLWNSAIANLR